MEARITKRLVDQVAPAERDLFVWDTSLRGFGLKVTPAGRKTYVYQYRIAQPGRASLVRRFRNLGLRNVQIDVDGLVGTAAGATHAGEEEETGNEHE